MEHDPAIDDALRQLFKALRVSPIALGSLSLHFAEGGRLMAFVPAPHVNVKYPKKPVAESARSVHTR